MHNIWIEEFEVTADPGRKHDRQSIFGASGNRDRGNADQVARRRECGMLDRRGIDANLHPLPQQIADQPVERLVGAIAHIIVIAREEGDAEVGRFHVAGL